MGIFSKPKAPDQSAIQRQQEKAAERERMRLEDERRQDKASALAGLKAQESKRAAFVGALNENVEDANKVGRKKFLRGV